MGKGWKSVNIKIAQIVKEHEGKPASELFKALSKVGGKNFRKRMKRVLQSIMKFGKISN